jgi:hypothetical protein
VGEAEACPVKELLRWLVTRMPERVGKIVKSPAGRFNAIATSGALVLTVILTASPFLEFVLKLIRPHATLGVPVLQLFVAFLVFEAFCILVIALRG